MITVIPGDTFVFKNPNTKADVDNIVSEVVKIIRAANPFMDQIEIQNKTKNCSVDIVFERSKLVIIFKNPKDAEFYLNELENPVTPVQITGR